MTGWYIKYRCYNKLTPDKGLKYHYIYYRSGHLKNIKRAWKVENSKWRFREKWKTRFSPLYWITWQSSCEQCFCPLFRLFSAHLFAIPKQKGPFLPFFVSKMKQKVVFKNTKKGAFWHVFMRNNAKNTCLA